MYKISLKDGKNLEIPVGESKTEKTKLETATKYLVDTIRNNGRTPEGDLVSPSYLKDLISTTEMKALLSSTTETIIREPIEPILAITGLYTPVRALGLDTKILLGAMGAVSAGDADEGGNYPEVNFDIGGGVSIATIGKSGIQASFTDEALRYTTWDIMAMNLKLMAAAVARHTEWKAINFLLSMGQPLFDNANPTDTLFGVTTGRDMSGAANGTLTMDDLMTGFTHMVETGFTPDTLIMSPQMYFMWVRDPILRHLFLTGNSGGVYFATYTGNPAVLPSWSNGSLGGRGPSNGYDIIPGGNVAGETATEITGYSQRATSAPVVPGFAGLPLRIIVSPLMPYDPSEKLGTIFLVASGMIGYHLIDEVPTTVEWRDEDHETVKVKIRQRDSFAVINDGMGIGVFKNIKNDQNFYHGDVQLTQSVSGTITEIDSSTPVV